MLRATWNKIRQRLVDDAHRCWRWLSVQLALLLVLLDLLAQYEPAIAGYLPAHWARYFGLAILIARIIKQRKAVPSGPVSPER